MADLTVKVKGANGYEDMPLDIVSLGYSKDTILISDKTVSRWVGTGYRTSYYKIGNTGDALIIEHNAGTCHFDDLFCDNVHVDKGYYTRQEEYGHRMAAVAKALGVPFQIASIFGGDSEAIFAAIDAAASVQFKNHEAYEDLLHELGCGISRRNGAICDILGDIAVKASFSGQCYSMALASFLAEHLQEPAMPTPEELRAEEIERKKAQYAALGLGYSCQE